MTISRVSDNMLVSQVLRNLNNSMVRLSDLQEQVSTGRIFSRPSDDPIGFTAALDYRARIQTQDRYLENGDRALANLSEVETHLSSLNDIVSRARELTLQAGGAGMSAESLDAIAEEIAQIFDQTLQIANTRGSDGYLFAGDRTDQTPFRLVEVAGGAYVEYVGDLGERHVSIANGVTISSSIHGLDAFLGGGGELTSTTAVADPAAPLAGQLVSAAPPLTAGNFTLNGVVIDVDPTVDSLADVRDRINDADTGITAEIDGGGGLVFTSRRSGGIEAASGTGNLLESLGLLPRVSGGTLETGGITESTSLSILGLSAENLTLSVNGLSYALDLSGAATVGDVINAFNTSGAGVRAFINAAGTGIDVTATSTGDSLEITDARRVFGSDIGSIDMDATLDAAGVTPPALGSISITNGENTVEVDLSSAVTIGDVLDAINASGAGVSAEINTAGTGIDVFSTSNANNLGPLVIAEVGGGASSAQLGILGSSTRDTASDLGITGSSAYGSASGVDLFDTLLGIESALRSGSISSAEIDEALSDLEAFLDVNSGNLSSIGARMNRVEMTMNRGEETRISLTGLLSENEDVDIAEVMTRLNLQQMALQASLTATARLIQPSLLDFLR
jgi:flagellin-like hook-associated protein FlgL